MENFSASSATRSTSETSTPSSTQAGSSNSTASAETLKNKLNDFLYKDVVNRGCSKEMKYDDADENKPIPPDHMLRLTKVEPDRLVMINGERCSVLEGLFRLCFKTMDIIPASFVMGIMLWFSLRHIFILVGAIPQNLATTFALHSPAPESLFTPIVGDLGGTLGIMDVANLFLSTCMIFGPVLFFLAFIVWGKFSYRKGPIHAKRKFDVYRGLFVLTNIGVSIVVIGALLRIMHSFIMTIPHDKAKVTVTAIILLFLYFCALFFFIVTFFYWVSSLLRKGKKYSRGKNIVCIVGAVLIFIFILILILEIVDVCRFLGIFGGVSNATNERYNLLTYALVRPDSSDSGLWRNYIDPFHIHK
ncbi:hypothetical protein NEFER03_2147 [Nematocida sp. LUAm3]|nr:hypothetical protein NEFER03_2147 [Nematocida sp. LUAm3]KAI5174618.1 hypothetical protein NEFER02_0739 [Nematocida sp. LUAm2]KAI5177976.1 hypothetical protein NEFER01_1158 [Nematocida sp. LUAm1]